VDAVTRAPQWFPRLVGLAAVLVAVGFGIAGIGWALGHVSDVLLGVKT
jgi:hypothetical protein